MKKWIDEAKQLLIDLVKTPSLSREEDQTALVLEAYLVSKGIPFFRKGNNIWAKNRHFDPQLPTILLNSHHDTVKPNPSYTLDPYGAIEKEGKLYGLGSNDAGASLVGLLATFLYYYEQILRYNLIFSATAEEEISGVGGIQSILEDLDPITFAIVGEPTQMNLAVAEKGLVVMDCMAKGTASHAAHENNNQAIYQAMKDILRIENYSFEKESSLLGKVKATVTMVNAGTQHNVIPDQCSFTIDVRTNECYTNAEVVQIMGDLLTSEVKPRSLRLNSSRIDLKHPIVQAAIKEGCICYGSPTISDQALIPFDSVKIGIGDSLRSHTADEFIYWSELEEGIQKYIRLLSNLVEFKDDDYGI